MIFGAGPGNFQMPRKKPGQTVCQVGVAFAVSTASWAWRQDHRCRSSGDEDAWVARAPASSSWPTTSLQQGFSTLPVRGARLTSSSWREARSSRKGMNVNLSQRPRAICVLSCFPKGLRILCRNFHVPPYIFPPILASFCCYNRVLIGISWLTIMLITLIII